MSSPRTEIHQCLTSMILFLRLFKTFQIGQLIRICQLLDQQPTLYNQKAFSRMLIQFIFHINQQNKKNHTENQYFSLVLTQSLIFNLYRHHNKNVINNSIYSNSLMISSSSQIGQNDQSTHSIKFYQNGDEYSANNFINFVQDFITDQDFKKKIKQMIDRQARKINEGVNQNQRYADILLQTIQYILNKQGKLDKNNDFQNVKQTIASKNTAINSHFEKKNLKVIISDVNKIIFSSKLNRIIFLLQEADENVYLSLLRIYFSQVPDQDGLKGKSIKYFNGAKYTGQQMILNLTWAYIDSIPVKSNLFQKSKNPLFRLIQAQLLCFYMPIFRSFHQIVSKCCKYDFSESLQFYKACEATINKDLFQFIQMLPLELLDFLRDIYHIILNCQLKPNKKQSTQNISSLALIAVKKLLVYSLLARSVLIQTYYSQGVDLNKYEQVCNYIINLFFKSSLRKYQSLSGQHQLISTLTKSISSLLDEKIITNYKYDAPDLLQLERSLGSRTYILEQPILNHDYEVLWDVMKNIQFTPKDLKQFQMHKKSQIYDHKLDSIIHGGNLNQAQSLNNTGNMTPFLNIVSLQDPWLSPMQRNRKEPFLSLQNQSIEVFQNGIEDLVPARQQIDFLTWMTIGGNRNYETEKSTSRLSSTRKLKQLKQVSTFPKQKIKQISNLYQKYSRLIS